MTNIFKSKLSWAPLLVVSLFVISGRVGATITSTFTGVETVPNTASSTIPAVTFTGGLDFTDSTLTAPAFSGGVDAVPEVKATYTLNVNSLPAAGTTITVGTCEIGFQNGITNLNTDCANDFAKIQVDGGATVSTVAADLQALVLLSDAVHGTLAVGGSGTEATFTTSGAETSATDITFVDGTSGAISKTSNTTGVVASSGVQATTTITVDNSLFLGATDDEVTIDGNLVDLSATTSTTDIATAIAAGVISADFTVSSVGNVVTFTRVAAGVNTDSLTIEDGTYNTGGPVAASDTVTIPAGLVANASDQSVTIDGVVVALGSSALTADDVAAAIVTAINNYNTPAKDYTASSVGANLTFTQDTPGAAGNVSLTIEDAEYGADAQEVTFTPASVSVGETFEVEINGTVPLVPILASYYYTTQPGDDAQDVVDALAPLIHNDGAVDCAANLGFITCADSTPGTGFTFDVEVVDVTAPVITSLSISPSTGVANIGDVITLTINSDQVGYTEDTITVNGESVAGFTDNGGGSYTATYTVASGDADVSSGALTASVELDDGDGNVNSPFTTVSANTLRIDANAPTLVSAITTSTTTIDLTFSEDLNGASIALGDFAVAGNTIVSASEISAGVVRLTVTTPFATSDTPAVTLTGNSVNDLAGNPAPFVASMIPSDGVAPVVTETTPVPTPDNDATPDYTFTTTEAGTITYGGDCSSTTGSAVAGPNTVTFGTLSHGVHSNCTVEVEDSSGNNSNTLAVTSFDVDLVAPTVVITSTATDPTRFSPIPFTITFSEFVTGFTSGDVQLQNGGLLSLTPTTGDVYSLSVLPLGQGDVRIDIDASEAQDTAGNGNTVASQFELTYDTVPPVITLVGTNPVNIEYGETYVDDGATASDTNDGDITGSIVTVNPVNTNTLGTYTVTYNVSDAAGNTATQVTRTVNVIQRAITVSAGTNTKVYDQNTSSATTPSITSGSLAGGDSATWSQVYNNKNVGTGKTLTPSGSVMNGVTDVTSKYAITFVNDTTGVITAKSLTVSATGVNKVYDGTTDATVTLSDDRIAGDVLVLSYTDADFNNKNVGNSKPVSVSGIAVSGADAGNYSANTTAATTADITPLAITGSITANNKVYDGDNSATIATRTLSGAISGDDVSYTGGTATFNNKNVGTGKPVSATGLSLSGADAGNYTVNTSAATTANITQLGITGSFTASNKVYDGNTSATITGRSLTGVLGADDVSYTGGTATFNNKNVGTGKTVSGSGFSLSGGDAGNYSVNTTATTTADITSRTLTISATGVNKVYDSTTDAVVTLSDNRVLGDVFTTAYTDAEFDDRHVGTGKTVSVSGISKIGTDADNYSANTSTTTTADVTPAPLTITALTNTKFYDGTTSALAVPVVTGLQGADTVTDLSEVYVDAEVGEAKNMFVDTYTVNDGNGGANYSVTTVLNNSGVIMRVFSSGGGSSGSRRSTQISEDTTPGQVLGETKYNFTQNMRQGVSGLEVVELQKLLNSLGFGPLVTDGKFGPLTRAAVIKFQLANGLVGDGIVGPLTRAVLNK